MREAWAWVAHADGKFAGAISPACGRKEVAKFCGGFIADGFTITPVYSREEYLALIEPMAVWQPGPLRKKSAQSEPPPSGKGVDPKGQSDA